MPQKDPGLNTPPLMPGYNPKHASGPQTVTINFGTPIMQKLMPATYLYYRQMRRHPTIAIARALAIAPVVAGEWTYKAHDNATDEMVKFIQLEMNRHREELLTMIMRGGTDFGWQGLEKIFTINRRGEQVIDKFKPLLHDITHILVDTETGWPFGFWQPARGTVRECYLTADEALLASFRVEGTNWYGESGLEPARQHYDDWNECNDGARRYDQKVAGAHWVVKYPPGSSTVGGVETDNATLAATIADGLKSSGTVAIAVASGASEEVSAFTAGANASGWSIELVGDESSGRQAQFSDRLGYLDKLMARALIVPERSVFEAQSGTRADASAHGDLAILHRELEHREVTRFIQKQVVRQLLALNFGEEYDDAVEIESVPLADDRRQWLRDVYKMFLSNPTGFALEAGTIDSDAMKDALDIPKSQEVAPSGFQDENKNGIPDDEEEPMDDGSDLPAGPASETPGQRKLSRAVKSLYAKAILGG